jgi:plasmid replication initiation protein
MPSFMKSPKPDLKSIVAKDNGLIGQMAKYELSELRLISYCMAHYDSRKIVNRTIEASVDDLKNIFNMTTKDAYAVVRKAVRAVNRKPFEIETERTEEEWYIFTGFRYFKHEGRFEFKVSPEAQPLLLKLCGNFTRYRLGDVYQFKAASTWKLYELLKRWLGKGKWEVELDELRSLLGVAGKYPRWSSLDQRILTPATKEINKLSDIRVSYDKIKRGRTVVGISFQIRKNRPEDKNVIEVKTTKEELYLALRKAGLPEKTAQNYTSQADQSNKTQWIIDQLPGLIQRSKNKKEPISYLQRGILNKIHQRSLFDKPEKPQSKPIEQQKAELKRFVKKQII